MVLITEVGIRMRDNQVYGFAGICQDCNTFWRYGGFEDYCSDCV